MSGRRVGPEPVTQDNTRRAVATIVTSAACFACVGAAVRLAGDVPVLEKVFFRGLVSLVAMSFVAFRNRENPLVRSPHVPLLVLRGIFGTLGMTLYFFALENLTLADAALLNKLSPFFVAAFAVLFLKERVSRYLVPTLVCAFVGAGLVIRPQLDLRAVPALAGFLSAVASGAAYTTVRSLHGRVPPYKVVFYFSLVSSVALLPPTLVVYVPPQPRQLLFLVAAGVFATAGQLFLTYAYHQAPATRISIYNYAHVVFAFLLGLALWGEVPDLLSLVGGVLILGAAVYNHRRVMTEEEVPTPT
jgi:drug/metabolite transporter (DMT)-like permease